MAECHCGHFQLTSIDEDKEKKTNGRMSLWPFSVAFVILLVEIYSDMEGKLFCLCFRLALIFLLWFISICDCSWVLCFESLV